MGAESGCGGAAPAGFGQRSRAWKGQRAVSPAVSWSVWSSSLGTHVQQGGGGQGQLTRLPLPA